MMINDGTLKYPRPIGVVFRMPLPLACAVALKLIIASGLLLAISLAAASEPSEYSLTCNQYNTLRTTAATVGNTLDECALICQGDDSQDDAPISTWQVSIQTYHACAEYCSLEYPNMWYTHYNVTTGVCDEAGPKQSCPGTFDYIHNQCQDSRVCKQRPFCDIVNEPGCRPCVHGDIIFHENTYYCQCDDGWENAPEANDAHDGSDCYGVHMCSIQIMVNVTGDPSSDANHLNNGLLYFGIAFLSAAIVTVIVLGILNACGVTLPCESRILKVCDGHCCMMKKQEGSKSISSPKTSPLTQTRGNNHSHPHHVLSVGTPAVQCESYELVERTDASHSHRPFKMLVPPLSTSVNIDHSYDSIDLNTSTSPLFPDQTRCRSSSEHNDSSLKALDIMNLDASNGSSMLLDDSMGSDDILAALDYLDGAAGAITIIPSKRSAAGGGDERHVVAIGSSRPNTTSPSVQKQRQVHQPTPSYCNNDDIAIQDIGWDDALPRASSELKSSLPSINSTAASSLNFKSHIINSSSAIQVAPVGSQSASGDHVYEDMKDECVYEDIDAASNRRCYSAS